MKARCNPSFVSQYANTSNGTVSIIDIVNGNVARNTHFVCIPGGHELVPVVNCTKRRPHFRHKNSSDVDGAPMTNWHAEWQGNFPITEQIFNRKSEQVRERRADVVLPEFKQIIEIQHSVINSGEVNDRNKDYGIHGFTVKWVLDAQDSIAVKYIGDRTILHFTTNYWLYESFVHTCDTVYYDVAGLIYKVHPKDIRSHQVDVVEPVDKQTFIASLKKNEDAWTSEAAQCYLYVKQQGAGSGKTYGMIQSLNNDIQFAGYKYIVCISKQHSAVHVIFSEFARQYENGLLENITVIEMPRKVDGVYIADNKKYIVRYKHNRGSEITVIFGTADSFTYAVGNKHTSGYDKFIGIVQSIKDGSINTRQDGTISYAGSSPILNKEMLLMIDETQDLTELYGEAFLQIVLSKHTNLCVVGDRLQSLSYEKNALTKLWSVERPLMKTIRGDVANTVRRFTSPRLISFVNDMINFDKYELPSISAATDIAPNTDDRSLTVFNIKHVNANVNTTGNEKEKNKLQHNVEIIMEQFEQEVRQNNRVPQDFLIVTPFTTKNPVVEALQIAINMFWKTLMESDTKYIADVKSNDSYWKDIDTTEYRRYAIFHRSEDGTSIDLTESEKATRIVSIHSAKGDGRPIVFVIGITEQALQKISKVSNNLVYESLLHVAITRQKERLYFALEENGDDIHKRITSSVSTIIRKYDEFPQLSEHVKMNNVAKEISSNSDWFDHINEQIIIPQNLPSCEQIEVAEKKLIDMGNHNLRYAAMFMNTLIHLRNYCLENDPNNQQLLKIFNNIRRSVVVKVDSWQEYYQVLRTNISTSDKKVNDYRIPVLTYSTGHKYQQYSALIVELVEHIINGIAAIRYSKMKYFCPLESIFMYYIIECIENPDKISVNINDIYDTLHIYSMSFTTTFSGHETCLCKSKFKEAAAELSGDTKKYYDYLTMHYEGINHTTSMLDRFSGLHPSIKWLYRHNVNYGGGNNGFKLYNNFDLIACSKDATYIFYLKPQFNELNYNTILVDSLFDTFLLSRANNERFHDKPVISCVLSMTCPEIYEINWQIAVSNNDALMLSYIHEIMRQKFSSIHPQLHNVYSYFVSKRNGMSPLKCFKNIRDKLSQKYPQYILKRFEDIYEQISEEKQIALDRYMDDQYFCEYFDRKLNLSLNEYLGLEDDD